MFRDGETAGPEALIGPPDVLAGQGRSQQVGVESEASWWMHKGEEGIIVFAGCDLYLGQGGLLRGAINL